MSETPSPQPADEPPPSPATYPVAPAFTRPRADTVGVIIGLLTLGTLLVPWTVGVGDFTFAQPGFRTINGTLALLDFPFASYSYEFSSGGFWIEYSWVQYLAIPVLFIGAGMIIAGSLSGNYNVATIIGGLLSAMAPLFFLGVAQFSSPTDLSFRFSDFVLLPAGAFLPVSFGLLAGERAARRDVLVEGTKMPPPSSLTMPAQFPSGQSLTVPLATVSPQFCPWCGARLDHEARFCRYCRRRVPALIVAPSD